MDADVLVIGGGLAGLAATAELAAEGRSVMLLDSEPLQALGGQAHWSLGGLFGVDTAEQRRMRIQDSVDLAWSDWLGSAAFDRDEDYWPRRWAEAYVDFAAGEQQSWLRSLGVRWFPVVQWAERGGYAPPGHGNSVPRFHLVWGTGPALVEPFAQAVLKSHRVRLRNRHKVTDLEIGADGVTVSRRRAGLQRRTPRGGQCVRGDGPVQLPRPGRGDRLRRHRRQSRSRPPQLAPGVR